MFESQRKREEGRESADLNDDERARVRPTPGRPRDRANLPPTRHRPVRESVDSTTDLSVTSEERIAQWNKEIAEEQQRLRSRPILEKLSDFVHSRSGRRFGEVVGLASFMIGVAGANAGVSHSGFWVPVVTGIVVGGFLEAISRSR